MKIKKRIRAKYGSMKNFCEENNLNYECFKQELFRKKFYGKNKKALIKSRIVKDENELEYLLYENIQAKMLAKLQKEKVI